MTAEIIPITIPRSLAAISAIVPALFVPNTKAAERFFEFFTANTRNKNTRRAYYKAACRFSEWCKGKDLPGLAAVRPMHIAAFIETGEILSTPPQVGRGRDVRVAEWAAVR